MRPRISIQSSVCHGQACVTGTRIPVHQILGMLANGDTVETLLQDYPQLTREDVMACLAYGAELARDEFDAVELATAQG